MASIRCSRVRSAVSCAGLLLGSALAAACSDSHFRDHGGAGDAADGGGGAAIEAGRESPEPAAGAGSAGRGGGGPSEAGAGGAGRASTAGDGPAGRSSDSKPTETTFVFRNDGEEVVMLGSNCGAVWPLLYEQDNQLGLVNSCSCPCDDPTVCGCPAICLNTQELVVPGKSVSKTWNGVALDYSSVKTRSCFVERVPAPGTKLKASACWNLGDSGVSQSCSEAWFAYGRDKQVTISAQTGASASILTKVGISNSSDGPIYVLKERCGSQGWFDLDMGEAMSVNTFCPCSCDPSFERGACPTCGGCPEDVIETIAPGGEIHFEWDSRFWYRYESGCANRYTMPAGSRVMAKFCWSRTPQGPRTCEPASLEVGQGAVLAAF